MKWSIPIRFSTKVMRNAQRLTSIGMYLLKKQTHFLVWNNKE